MAGLSFVTTGFLIAGAAAAALPIVIHLLLRQRARMMPIGSVRFLQDVIRQHTRRRRIRQWILLLLRVLVILLLAMLFARPYFDRSATEGLNREVVVLIDRSASMQVKADNGTRVFSAAVETANGELRSLDENTAIHIALYDAGGVQEIAIDELDSAQPSDASSDHGVALSWAQDIVATSGRPNRQIILITDLQRSGLGVTTVDEFPEDVDVVVRDVGRTLAQNIAIESAESVVTEIRPGEPVRVAVRVSNSGAVLAKRLPVKIELSGPNGALVKTEYVDLAGGQRRVIEFDFQEIQADGVYRGKVSIAHTDDLEIDNTRWLALEARRPDRILLVDGQEGRSVYANETYYLETALRLRAPAAAAPLRSFEVERIVWEDGDGFPNLDGFRAIVMANAGRLSATDASRLRDYANAGGNLLFFCGDQTKPAVMSPMKTVGLFPASVRREPLSGPWRIDAWNKEHPALAPFADVQNGDLRRLRFDRIVELINLDEDTSVLLESEDRPLLIEKSVGNGAALFFMSSADMAWSRWPQNRLYVPLIRQLMAYLTSQLSHRLPVVREKVAHGTGAAGVFDEGGKTVVRNTDSSESQLERVSEEEFRLAFNLAERKTEAMLSELAANIDAPRGAERANESWNWVVWALFVLLTAEIFLASRVHA